MTLHMHGLVVQPHDVHGLTCSSSGTFVQPSLLGRREEAHGLGR
jgi:hypothetical protein